MSRTRTAAVGVALGTLVLAACSGGSGEDGGAMTSVPLTTEATAPPSSLPASSPTSAPGAGATTSTTSSPSLGAPVGTQAYTAKRAQKVPPAARVTGVRTGAQDGYDRVVFDFEGALPGSESVQYVSGLTQDGSGAPVPLNGQAFLKVVFSVTEAHGAGGASSIPQGTRVDPGLPTVKEVALAADFEGYVTFGIGLSGKAGFRVFELSNPTRVVVDVAH